jgi:hypothetical protein
MDEQQRTTFLRDEYLQLQKVIEDFDGRAITIKAWSITFSLVAIVGAFATHAPIALLVGSLSSALFWLIEGFWKSFQDAYYERAYSIERFFSGDNAGLIPFQIGNSWYIRWKKGGYRRLFRIMSWPHVALPHFVVLLVGLLLYALQLIGVIQV